MSVPGLPLYVLQPPSALPKALEAPPLLPGVGAYALIGCSSLAVLVGLCCCLRMCTGMCGGDTSDYDSGTRYSRQHRHGYKPIPGGDHYGHAGEKARGSSDSYYTGHGHDHGHGHAGGPGGDSSLSPYGGRLMSSYQQWRARRKRAQAVEERRRRHQHVLDRHYGRLREEARRSAELGPM